MILCLSSADVVTLKDTGDGKESEWSSWWWKWKHSFILYRTFDLQSLVTWPRFKHEKHNRWTLACLNFFIDRKTGKGGTIYITIFFWAHAANIKGFLNFFVRSGCRFSRGYPKLGSNSVEFRNEFTNLLKKRVSLRSDAFPFVNQMIR